MTAHEHGVVRARSSRPLHSALAGVAMLVTGLAEAAPPPAPSHPVTEVLHGVSVVDPYRNLEDLQSPETRGWLAAEGVDAADRLAGIPEREAIAQRITQLANASGDRVWAVTRMPGDRIYYLRRKVGEGQFKLVMRVGATGADRVLVDPAAMTKALGVPHAINYFKPSWDGKTLAYGISAGGSENASLYLLDIASGRPIGQPIPRVIEGLVHWAPDSRSLTYNQRRVLPEEAPPTETFLDTTVFHLVLGQPESNARALFGPLVDPLLKLDRLDVAEVLFAPGSRYMIARTTDTTVPEGRLFVAPLAALGQAGRAPIAWRPISVFEDKITDVSLRGGTLYLRSYAGAPRGRVLALALSNPSLSRAVEVVPEPANGTLRSFSVGRDALYVQMQSGFTTRTFRHAFGRTRPGSGTDIAPGVAGSVQLADHPADVFTEPWAYNTSWIEPPRMLALGRGGARDTGLIRIARPPDTPELEVSEVLVPSHDGVGVPLAILRRKGLAMTGNNPTLLEGYGAYGSSIPAFFDLRSIAWLERGGVLAYANVRGSGAFGDAWHRAGYKSSKPNTWQDGLACARYLIDQRYTAKPQLGIKGTSAGGIFVGRAVTAAPELFAAAIFDVGLLDTVRAELSANGATNISEFGTVAKPDEFAALLEMSTYHHIAPETAYPSVLLIHGMNDPRVDVWHSAKTAALLKARSSSGKPVLLRLDAQAGHGIGSTAQQAISQQADMYAFLLWQFGKSALAP